MTPCRVLGVLSSDNGTMLEDGRSYPSGAPIEKTFAPIIREKICKNAWNKIDSATYTSTKGRSYTRRIALAL